MPEAARPPLRIMSYNIRAALGMDGARSLNRIAEVIGRETPDIVALQEVDIQRPRSGRVHQAARLGELVNLHWLAAPSFADADGGYGNAILSRYPLHLLDHHPLPGRAAHEPRSVMIARIDWAGAALCVINTHLSFRRRERAAQLRALLTAEWLCGRGAPRRTVLCGDLNCAPREPGFRRLCDSLRDAARHGPARATWPTRRPFRRIDHLLVSPDLDVVGAHVHRSALARVASDHYPVIAQIR